MSVIRKYHNHKLQTNPRHCEEEPHNNNETPVGQTKQSNQLSLPHRDDCKTRMDRKKHTTKHLMAMTKIKRPTTQNVKVDLPLRSETNTEEETQATVIEVQENHTNHTWAEKRGGGLLKCVVMATVYYMPSVKAPKKTRLPICDELCVKLWNEVNDNKQYCQTFLSGDTDILDGNDKYIAEKQYNADCADIILLALCNALARLRLFISIEKTVVLKKKT